MNKPYSIRAHVLLQPVFLMLLLGQSLMSAAQNKEKGVNIGIVYPLSIQGIHSTAYTNVFSVHMLMGMSKAERGFTAAGLANIIKDNAEGFQTSGFLNYIGGSAEGFKAAGFLNVYHDAIGFQAAGFANLANGNVRGMQAAGFMNMADDFRGMQASAFINMGEEVNGTQASGFINIADNVEGAQIAGFINIAKKVKGAQIAGFINIADSSKYPIGIVNLVRTGEKYIGITSDDNATTMLTFRSGSDKVYGVIGLGYNFQNKKDKTAIIYGLGVHLVHTNKFRLKTEGTVTHLENFRKGEFIKTSVSVLPAIKAGKRLEIFAGPSINYINTTSQDGRKLIEHYLWQRTREGSNREYGIYLGYSAGIHLALN